MSDNLIVRDGALALKALRTTEVSPGVHAPHHYLDALPGIAKDAFGRLRVSTPAYRFDSQLTYGIDADLWDVKETNGTASHSATERWVELSANASGANSVILQSHYHAPYTAGRGQLAFVTGRLGEAPAAGGYKRMGYFDGSNGVYLERTATAVNVASISTTTHGAETVAQANWNVDKMDGTGPSKMTLDLNGMQIFFVQMQALYVGRVTVGFDIGGDLIPVHVFDCANSEAVPYIAQANLPIRYECGGTAATSSATVMHAVCSSVISEGGPELEDVPGRDFVSTGSFANSASKVLTVIRCKAQLNSINQNALVIPIGVDVSIVDAGAWVSVLLNPTVTAGTFTNVNASSVIEHSWAGNGTVDPTITGGTLVDRFYVSASASVRGTSSKGLTGKLVLSYSHLLAAGDRMAVLVEGGATTDAFGALTWKEIR